jgi:hypothetical protein
MTEKHINQIKAQPPEGEKIERMYRAFEGDIRVITKDRTGRETRYTVHHDTDDNVTIERK